MRCPGRLFAVLACILFAGAPWTGLAAANASAGQDVAEFSYAGPSGVKGPVEASCRAWGTVFRAGTHDLTIHAAQGRLRTRATRVNETIVGPGESPWVNAAPDHARNTLEAIPSGDVHLAWNDTGLAYATARDRQGGPKPFAARLHGESTNASAVQHRFDTPAPYAWNGTPDQPAYLVIPGFHTPSRAIAVAGQAAIAGSFTVYLRGARVVAGSFDRQLPPWRIVESDVATPAVERRTLAMTDALLELDAGTVVVEDPMLACDALDGSTRGGFIADQATGHAVVGGRSVAFNDRVVSLEGAFEFHEASEASDRTAATAAGRITVLGVDYAPGGTGRSATAPAVEAVLALAAILLSLKYLGSIVGFLYSRLAKDKILGNPNRDRLHEMVRAAPGRDLSSLARGAGLYLTTVAYHVQVLQRAGLVTTVRHGHSLRVLPRSNDRLAEAAHVLASLDPRFSVLRNVIGPQARPLAEVVPLLTQRLGLGRRASYNVVADALRRRIVRRIDTDAGVLVECA